MHSDSMAENSLTRVNKHQCLDIKNRIKGMVWI